MTPQNANSNPSPQGQGALRLLAVGRGVVLGTGDIAVLPILNSNSWAPATVAFVNGLVNGVSATIAAANLGLFTGPGATGNTIRTAGVLTGQTASTVFTAAASPAAAVAQTAQQIYVNATVGVAGGVVDIFVYGYDLSNYTP
jgi:hypothetical protein